MESTTEASLETPAIPLWPTLMRGARARCPKCGKGKLFKSYLKPVDHCAVCNEHYGEIRADDGPAWLTIMITGHLFAFLLIFASPQDTAEPDMLGILLLVAIAAAFALFVLHYAKGFFVALIWRIEQKKLP